MPEPTLRHVTCNGVALACFEWRAELRGERPTLLLVHATGFHGRVWDQVIARLPGRHVIALELRGHGRSETAEITGWEVFGRDIAAFVEALGLTGLIGVGHSVGGHALVQAAAFAQASGAPGAFARLILIDPVLLAPADYHLPPRIAGDTHPAAGRKRHFASAAEMFARFADRPPYAVFDRAVLRDYCEHGLLPAADGTGFTLACAPETEARVYRTARADPGVYASVRALKIPVLILRARRPTGDPRTPDFGASPTWPQLVSEFADGREIHLPEHSHLIPMQDPGLVARVIAAESSTETVGPAAAPAPPTSRG